MDGSGVGLSDMGDLDASFGISEATIIAALLHCCPALPPERVGWSGVTGVGIFIWNELKHSIIWRNLLHGRKLHAPDILREVSDCKFRSGPNYIFSDSLLSEDYNSPPNIPSDHNQTVPGPETFRPQPNSSWTLYHDTSHDTTK